MQPSKISSAAGHDRMPIFFSCAPNENPGDPFSTRNAVMAFDPADGSSDAKTRYRSASGAFEIQILEPVSRYEPSSARSAFVRMAPASDPACGSVSANAPSASPAIIGPSQ